MTKKTFVTKQNGNTLEASEWNELTEYVNQAVDAINAVPASSGSSSSDASGVVSVNSKGNTTISAAKHINIEPAYDTTGSTSGTYGDVQIKPGDDITLESHHRTTDKRDEITIKTSNGLDGNAKAPVKLQVIASDMTLSTKGKKVEAGSNDSTNVMNVNVTTGSGKGYLKVRALAIDLRCEEHGGIALQPKGEDNSGNENKIKFEHGGGDGLEFGTFNTEKTSIFTDEYRFNKDGVWKMATRTKEVSDKADENDSTTAYKYVKQADDFYDVISGTDEQCTTKDIIKTAYAMNGNDSIHTHITNKGNLEIESVIKYLVVLDSTTSVQPDPYFLMPIGSVIENNHKYTQEELISIIGTGSEDLPYDQDSFTFGVDADGGGFVIYTVTKIAAPSINIESADNIKIKAANALELKGILDFGSTFNFGETDDGIQTQYKLTKKNATKDCGVLKIIGINNSTSNTLTIRTADPSDGTICDYSIPEYVDKTSPSFTPSLSNSNLYQDSNQVIASCSLNDIIMFVNWAKGTGYGPWSSEAISNKEDYTWDPSTGNWTSLYNGQLDPDHQL